MDTLQLVLLAVIQGLTEWLPISSSAHLILFPTLSGLPNQGPLIDAMAHLGSLGAVLVYFHRDVRRVLQGLTDLVLGRQRDGLRLTPESKLLLLIALATPPGLLVGFALSQTGLLEALRNPTIIGAASLGFGVLLWAADHYGKKTRVGAQMTYLDAVLVGLAQMLAFIPGASRSGVAMTAMRALGFSREESARFGMLVGVPLIAAVGFYALFQLLTGESPDAIAADGSRVPVTVMDGVIVAALSFVSAWISVAAMMRLLRWTGFLPFVIYRVGLGLFLLAQPLLS